MGRHYWTSLANVCIEKRRGVREMEGVSKRRRHLAALRKEIRALEAMRGCVREVSGPEFSSADCS